MAIPGFTPKAWQDAPSPTGTSATPLDAAALVDLEERVTNYSVTCAETIPQGPQGPTGPAGVTATGPPGVGANWRGVWSSGTTYAVGDGAYRNGTPYISNSSSNLNHDPATDSGTNWGRATYDGYGSTFINIKDQPYGAAGDGVTDDTAAIQAAIDYLLANDGGTIYFPAATYLIAGSLVTSKLSLTFNAQLCLHGPTVSDAVKQPVLRFLGDRPVAFNGYTNTTGGSILVSNLSTGAITGGVAPSMIGGPSGAGFIALSFISENMVYRCPVNPTVGGLDLANLDHAGFLRSRVETPDNPFTVTQPTHTWARGLVMPQVNCSDQIYIRDLYIQGFYSGITTGEHMVADNVSIRSCYIGIVPGLLASTGHNSMFGYVSHQWCPYVIAYATPAGGLASLTSRTWLDIGCLDLEDGTVGNSAPAWTFPIDHFYDPNSWLAGNVNVHMSNSAGILANGAYCLNYWLDNGARPPIPVGGTGGVAFQNSWTWQSCPASYTIDRSGIVRLAGSVTGGASGTVAFTLPRPFQPLSPAGLRYFPSADVSNGHSSLVAVDSSGNVTISWPSGGGPGASLDVVSFLSADRNL